MIDTTVSLAVDDREGTSDQALLYPLRFEPIYQYRLWGGRHLARWLTAPLPSGPVGEAWLLSDRDDHQSRVSDGPLKGQSVGQLLRQFPKQILGKLAGRFHRFPLLLKFLDVHEMLSVQVHPTKANTNLLPSGRDRKDRSLGRAGSRGTKPHLCGPEAKILRKPICGVRSPTARWPTTSHV